LLQSIEILNTYFDTTIRDLIRSYEYKGLKASGAYGRSLVKEITQDGSKTTAKIKGASHIYYAQHGRRPNKNKTAGMAKFLGKILEQWVKDKGIIVNPYVAAWKIVREGWAVPNRYNPGGVVSDVINDDWLHKIVELLRYDEIKHIRSEVIKEFKMK
jgi:hypothetical protein